MKFFIVCISFFVSSSRVYSESNFEGNEILNAPFEENDVNYLQKAQKGSKVCMDELGCFELTKDFYHILYRPFNFLPFHRKKINTLFHLFTRSNPKEAYDLLSYDKANINRSPLDRNVPTIFIIHGFLDTILYVRWMESLKDNLLLYKDHNVIVVDWSGGNYPPYTQATANTRVVGAEIALMIDRLQIKRIYPMDCHIIGHSLGAHIAGYAGVRLKKLGRISAVDPAEPFFQYMPSTVRLDPSDANFVDVIHSDSQSILLFGLGMSQAVGHVDFYPNEGKNQPGCKTEVFRSIFLDGLVEASRRFISCNHQRAVDFFIHSINYRRAVPVAYACSSWKDYTLGNCASCGRNGTKCAIMGIRANEYLPMKNDSQSLKLYISTSGSAPFWVFHYQISVKLFKPQKRFSDQSGKFTISLNGTYNTLKTDLSSRTMNLYHGATYKFLVTSKKELGPIQTVDFTWKSTSWSFFSTKTIFIEFLRVLPMNIIDYTKTRNESRTFCYDAEKPIKSGTSIVLRSPCEENAA